MNEGVYFNDISVGSLLSQVMRHGWPLPPPFTFINTYCVHLPCLAVCLTGNVWLPRVLN